MNRCLRSLLLPARTSSLSPLSLSLSPSTTATTSTTSTSTSTSLLRLLLPPGVRHGASRRTVQVLLLHEVPGLGQPGDMPYVNPGRARNQLLPSGDATYATYENKHRYAHLISAAAAAAAAATTTTAAAAATATATATTSSMASSSSPTELELARIQRALQTLASRTVRLTTPADARRLAQDHTDVHPYPRHHLTADLLRAAILNQLGVDVATAYLDLDQPLTTFGKHQVPLRLTVPSEDGLAIRPAVKVLWKRAATAALARDNSRREGKEK